MNKRLIIAVMLFTVFVCGLFVVYNPNITDEFENETFGNGEVFTQTEGVYDFKILTLKSPDADNYTAHVISSGHTLLVDESGDKCINILEFDKMLHSQKDSKESFLHSELKKPGWSVDGVEIHQIDFLLSDSLYSAYIKNSTTDTVVYIATPSEKETAEMVNSLIF